MSTVRDAACSFRIDHESFSAAFELSRWQKRLCVLTFRGIAHLDALIRVGSLNIPTYNQASELRTSSVLMDSQVDVADFDGGDENISVCLRIRQFTPDELSRNDKLALTCSDGKTVMVRGKLPDRDDKDVSCSYALTCALTQTCSQSEMFDRCGIRDLLDSCVNGYSSTVFAYGQTGSGKTYTIVGPEQQVDALESRSSDVDGIIARSVKYLFRAIEKRSDAVYRVECSYLELYNEQVRDLVSGTGDQLGVKFDPQKNTFYVDKLSIIPCSSKRDVMRVFSRGFKRTRVASHDLNSRSNRSHCVFTVYLHYEPNGAKDDAEKAVRSRHGKISFVDLAGSERIKQTGAVGKTAKESGQINKSLFTLGKVISVLSDNKPGKFVPYRDSKLTMLLMDSIGGNAKTLMIACCSPSDFHLYESLRCLEFASRTKNIRNKPVIQRDPTQNLIFELKREIKKLREQNKQLQGAVMSSLAAINSSQVNPNLAQPSNISRSSVSTGAGSEPARRQAAVQLHLFDSDSEGDPETPAPFAKTALRPQPAKADRPQAEDEPANADLISRTQWFLQMHQDKPQDTYEKLLFDELKTLVAEYSVTRKTGSLNPREGISSSSSKLAAPSSFGTKTQIKLESTDPMQTHHQSTVKATNRLDSKGWDPASALQQALQQRAAALQTSQRQQSSHGFGHTPSLKMHSDSRLDSSSEDVLRRVVGPASSVGLSPPSSHGMNHSKRFGHDSSRQESVSYNGGPSGSAAIVTSVRPSTKYGSSSALFQRHKESDDSEDDFDLMMANDHQRDQDSALQEIEQLKLELDRESANFQVSMRMQQLHQVQQQQILHQQQQQILHQQRQQHKPSPSLPLIAANRGSPLRHDYGPDAELPRRRQHQRASQSISLSSSTAWPPSGHSPPLSRLQTSSFQGRSMEQLSPQRLVRSETGAAEKEGWKNRVSKAEAAIRYFLNPVFALFITLQLVLRRIIKESHG